MVADLVRLKLRLTANGLRRSPWVLVGFVLAVAYGIGVLVAVLSGMAFVSSQAFEVRQVTAVVAGSALVLAWWVVPMVAFGVDSTLDPARFAVFPIPQGRLLVGLTLGALLGVPGVLTAAACLGSVVLWRAEPPAMGAGLVGAVLAVLTCVVGSRALTTALAPVVVKRRVREVGVALVLVPIALAGPLLSRLIPADYDLRQADVEPLARVLGWTPIGAAWAIAPDVASGSWGRAAARLLVALATLAVLTLAWRSGLARSLVEPVRETTKARERGLGLFGRLPATPLGAVVARCLTYWVRDPRYAMAVVLVPVLPVVFALVDPAGRMLLVAAPLSGFLMGWAISADVAYDGTAYWMHVASPLRGVTDRWGRAIAAGSLAVVVVVVLAVAGAVAIRRPETIPALLGCGLGAAGTALGVASVASALVVYPVRQPGDSPFSVRQGATMPAMLTQLGGWAAVLLLLSPVVVLAGIAVIGHHPGAGWAALVVGPAVGAGVLVLGAWLGGRLLDRTSPDLLRRLLAMT